MSRSSFKRTKDYYRRTRYSSISNTLWEAIQFSKKFDKRALDIGCGAFRDSKFLINCGYSVTAV
ncbi:hypothetical protein IID22_05360, partial [Patescibacteria group bacterium]|nr:hypothetical protein [Patescibacteria group bacterium]